MSCITITPKVRDKVSVTAAHDQQVTLTQKRQRARMFHYKRRTTLIEFSHICVWESSVGGYICADGLYYITAEGVTYITKGEQ